MRDAPLPSARSGFLLIEAMIGIALFAIFLGAVGVAFLASLESTLSAGDRQQAIFLTEQGLEAAGAIRDKSFASLTAGTHGFAVQNGQWAFTGSQRTGSGFVTKLTVTVLASDWVRVDARTAWNKGRSRSGSVFLSAEYTDWRTPKAVGNWAAPVLAGSYVDSGTPLFNCAVRAGNYLFVGSDTSAGGAGLYIFDVSNEAAPVRVSAGFILGTQVLGMAMRGNVLFLLTMDPMKELQAYNVSAPASLTSGNLITSVDLPGSALGLSLAQQGNILYVGAKDDAVQSQFYAVATTGSGALTLTGSLRDPGGGMTALSPRGTIVYAADTNNVSELRVVDASNPHAPRLANGSGYNLTDVLDGSAVTVAGTGVLLGRLKGVATEEIILFDVAANPVPSSPGPWVYDLGDNVHALASDFTNTYAFAATDFVNKELTILKPGLLHNGQNPQVAVFHSTQGLGRGVSYDPGRDRVYLLTNKALYILKSS